jgi:bacteriorhodopsin
MVSSDVFLRNSLQNDLVTLYFRLVDLGMEYRYGKVYLADIENLELERLKAKNSFRI